MNTTRTTIRLVLLAVYLAGVRTSFAITYAGYQTSAEIKPGTEQVVPLAEDPKNRMGLGMNATPQPPEWVSRSDQVKGFAQLCFLVQPHNSRSSGPPMGGEAEARGVRTMLLDILCSDATMNLENFSSENIFQRPEQYSFRLLFDQDGNQSFDPDEVRELTPPSAAGQSQLRLTTRMALADMTRPDGKPLDFQVDLYIMRMGRREMQGDPLQFLLQTVNAQMYALLPLTADVGPKPGMMKLQLNVPALADPLHVTGYTLMQSEDAGNVPPGQENYRLVGQQNNTLESPLKIGDRWVKIASIAPDLSSLTLAEPGGDFQAPSRGLVGDVAPEWARVDLISRRIVNFADFQGKMVVLAVNAGQNSQNRFNGYRLMAQRLIQDGGRERVVVVFIDDYIEYERFFAETSGNVDLPYVYVTNRDFISQGDEKTNLNTLFWNAESQPLTIVVDSSGTIVLRENGDLYSVLPRVIRQIKPSVAPTSRAGS